MNEGHIKTLTRKLYGMSRIDVLRRPKKHKPIKLFISLFPFLYPKLSKWFWDKNGGEEYHQKSLHSPQHINARIILKRVLSDIEFGNLLEVGCGTGDNLSFLKRVFNNKNFTGCDFSKEQILVAREEVNVKFDLANACLLPYKDKEFDVVITVGCLAHIPKKYIKKAVSEIQRVCKNYLIIQEEDTEFMHPGIEIIEGYSGFHFYHNYKTLFEQFETIPINPKLNKTVYLHVHFLKRCVWS